MQKHLNRSYLLPFIATSEIIKAIANPPCNRSLFDNAIIADPGLSGKTAGNTRQYLFMRYIVPCMYCSPIEGVRLGNVIGHVNMGSKTDNMILLTHNSTFTPTLNPDLS